jgi:hypothetical protein
MCTSLNFQSNIYITKMYGTMNIKLQQLFTIIKHYYLLWDRQLFEALR